MPLPALIWLLALSLIAVFDVQAAIRHKTTLSQWVWTSEKAQPWFRWAVAIGLLYLTFHLCVQPYL